MKFYALYWINSDNFEDIVVDKSGTKTELEILEEIGKNKKCSDGTAAYFLVEKQPIEV